MGKLHACSLGAPANRHCMDALAWQDTAWHGFLALRSFRTGRFGIVHSHHGVCDLSRHAVPSASTCDAAQYCMPASCKDKPHEAPHTA
eukprot:117039-Chlamydomonas_euryale.AAC.1